MRICTRSWPWLTACCQSSSIRDSLLTQTKSRDNTSAEAERGEKILALASLPRPTHQPQRITHANVENPRASPRPAESHLKETPTAGNPAMTADEAPVLTHIRRWLTHVQPDTDAELVRRFVAGRDEDAFAALVDRHGPMVLGVARRVTADCHAADDVLQAAFLTLARQAAGLRRPGAVAAWLHRTAHRLALTAVRARERRGRAERSAPPAPHGDPLADLSARELLGVLDEELRRLPDGLHQALVLCCLEGRTPDEAAKLLGCSPGAIRGRLERGRRRLRDRLARRGLTFAVAAGTPLLISSPGALAASLRESAIATAMSRAGPSPTVESLIESGLSARRWGVLVAAAVGFASIGALVTVWSQRPAGVDPVLPPRADVAPVASSPDAAPLPAGAVARLAWDPLRIGHAQAALTADGKKVVALASGAVVHTFDAATGKLLDRRPLGDRRHVPADPWYSLLSADGSVAAVEDGHRSYHCTVWDLETGKQLLGRSTSSRARSLSADGRSLATIEYVEAKQDWAVRVYDLRTGGARDVAYTGQRAITDLWLTPDGKRLIARAQEDDGSLICYDVAGAKELWTVPTASSVASCTFTPDGRTLIVADTGAKERFRAIDVETGRPAAGFRFPDYKAFGVAAAAGDRLLLVPLRSGEVAVWDYRAGKELRRLRATTRSFITVYVFPAADGKTAITDGDGLRRWNLETGEQIFGPAGEPAHYGSVHALAFEPDGRLVSAAAGGELRRWDVTFGRPVVEPARASGSELWVTHAGLRTVKQDYAKAVLNVVDAAGKTVGKIAVTDDPKSVGMRDWHHSLLADGRTAITYLPRSDGDKRTARVTATDYVAGKIVSQVEVPLPGPYDYSPAFSPCGRWLAVGAQVFAVSSGKSVWTPSAGEGWILHFQMATRFSPDGRLYCGRVFPQSTTDKDDFDRGEHDVWEVASGARLTRFAAKNVGRITIITDNRKLA